MVDQVVPLTTVRPVIETDGSMNQEFRAWSQSITNQSLIVGENSPEGVIAAPIGKRYMDVLGTTGSLEYLKRDKDDGAGDTSIGWILCG